MPSPDDLTTLRTCVNRQQPFGSPQWQRRIAAQLGWSPRCVPADAHDNLGLKSSLSSFLQRSVLVRQRFDDPAGPKMVDGGEP